MGYMDLKPMVTSGEPYTRFEAYLKELKEKALLNLSSANDPQELYRHQGHIACLTHLLSLKSRIQADSLTGITANRT
jgi:hypothetical protein